MAGGNGGGPFAGAGGQGYDGSNGDPGYSSNSGGGGGGAGYGSGGSGGKGVGSGGAGGTAGTKANPSGQDGEAGSGGGGGGGGGAGYSGGTGSSTSSGTTYIGGKGGNGGDGRSNPRPAGGGGGGAGGAGFYTRTSTTGIFANNAIGGNGGNGGSDSNGRSGGGGGDGGAGLQDGAADANLTLASGYFAKGGAGGRGKSGAAGGAGVLLTGRNATLTNNGQTQGGTGGFDINGIGGQGGAGVAFAASGGTLINTVAIGGGNGGGGTGGTGVGGSGVIGAGLKIENNSAIVGGSGATRADAITFQSGTNTLALGATSSITGAVDIQAGTLTFDQSALSGAPANVTLSNTIIGGGGVIKVGAGTLTLSGTNTYTGGTAINGGTLSVAADANLGAAAGGLSFQGGTLETTAGFTSARAITLNGVGTVQVDSGSLTLLGPIGGTEPQFIKSGAGTLVLSNAGNTYKANTTINAGTLSIAADSDLGAASPGLNINAGTLEITATLTSARTISLGRGATVQVDTGTTTFSGSITGAAALTKTGAGTLVLSGNSNNASGQTITGGTLDLASAAAAGRMGATTTFAGTQASSATLMLETGAQPASGGTFRNTLVNFGANDALGLAGFTYSALDTATVTTTGTGTSAITTLTFTDNSNIAAPKTERFTLGGTHDSAYFVHDAGTKGIVIDDTPCFAAGTRIGTLRGETVVDVAVEHLAVGDRVVTAAGTHRPIRWLGHRTLDCRRHPRPREAYPIRIAAHAFAPNRPARDVFVSPGHAICVDVVGEVLIPAGALVNGSTIRQVEVDTVTYWHVELDAHDVILAENLPAESYIDCGNRGFFAEAAAVDLAPGPNFAPRLRAQGEPSHPRIDLAGAAPASRTAPRAGAVRMRRRSARLLEWR